MDVQKLINDKNKERLLKKGIPAHAIPKKKVKQGTATDLQNVIIQYCAYFDDIAVNRVNSQGQWDERLKMWRKSGSTKGISDLEVIYKGRIWYCEIKWGNDSQRPDQKKFQERMEKAGALYSIVKSFDDFTLQLTEFKKRCE